MVQARADEYDWRGGEILRGGFAPSPLATLLWRRSGEHLRDKPQMMRGWQGGKRYIEARDEWLNSPITPP